MPKKFAGENSKAVAAKARKEAVRENEKQKKKQQDDDAMWMDNDKGAMKKQQRKEEQEKKKIEQAQKKAEAKALLEEEMSSIKKVSKPAPSPKVTVAKIQAMKQAQVQAQTKKEDKKIETHLDVPVEENINRIEVDGDEARTITEAINILSVEEKHVDKHPEKRMKAAYNAFEERRLIELKAEHPSLRLSQLKQMIFKEWQKSPENPLNNV